MSYQHERDQFIDRMAKEGLPLHVTTALLRAATTIQRYAELACSSEAADRDRVDCPRAKAERIAASARTAKAIRAFERYPCLCDYDHESGHHTSITRITLQEWQTVQRLQKALDDVNGFDARKVVSDEDEANARPGSDARWLLETQGDPRGYTLRIIPPSYAERNKGRDRFNRDTIGVPARDSRLRF